MSVVSSTDLLNGVKKDYPGSQDNSNLNHDKNDRHDTQTANLKMLSPSFAKVMQDNLRNWPLSSTGYKTKMKGICIFFQRTLRETHSHACIFVG